MELAAKMEMDFRLRAVRNMMVVIVTITITMTYGCLYTIILYIWASDDCYV